MIITCPACASQFRIPDDALGATGRKLRCSACRHVWFQAVETAAEGAPPEAAATAQPPSAPPPETAPEPDAAADQPAEHDMAESPPPFDFTGGQPDEPAGEVAAEPATEAGPPPAVEGRDHAAAPPEEVAPPPAAGDETVAEARPGLRLVPRERFAEPEAAEPPVPTYDVTRVVAPDAAPDEEARPAPVRRRRGRGGLLVLLLLVAAVAGALVERDVVMRYLPQSAALYVALGLVAPDSRGLKIDDVAFRVDEQDGVSVLVVSGTVSNLGPEFRLLPELQASLLDGSRAPTHVWTLHAAAKGLAPGARTVFEASFADPPRTGSDEYLFVTFADRM